jgi:hypothetical protein
MMDTQGERETKAAIAKAEAAGEKEEAERLRQLLRGEGPAETSEVETTSVEAPERVVKPKPRRRKP